MMCKNIYRQNGRCCYCAAQVPLSSVRICGLNAINIVYIIMPVKVVEYCRAFDTVIIG